jgi:hypothetical protein
MIVHHRETTDTYREEFRKFLEPVLDPLHAIVISFPHQERAAHAACDAVVPAGQRDIDELGASDRHKRSPAEGARITVRINSRPCKIDWRVRRQKSPNRSVELASSQWLRWQCEQLRSSPYSRPQFDDRRVEIT